MTKPATEPEASWSILVRPEDVPENGLKLSAIADAKICAGLARLAGVDAVLRLQADLDVVRRGKAGLSVSGIVSARVRQTCVLTLEPLENDINEPIAATFSASSSTALPDIGEAILAAEDDEPPEPLIDGRADLGRLATEFFVLAVDRYPRRPGAEFQPPVVGAAGESPFAALAALKKDPVPPS
jgi:hypothetical protein